jgi:hypothetical protein
VGSVRANDAIPEWPRRFLVEATAPVLTARILVNSLFVGKQRVYPIAPSFHRFLRRAAKSKFTIL